MEIKPLGNNVVVELKDATPTTTESGVLLPQNLRDDSSKQGVIVAMGPGIRKDDGVFIPLGVEVGDTILLPQYSMQKIRVDGKDLYVLPSIDILAIIK
jgi:chaperonin GroES